MIPLFDLHCDTFLSLFQTKQALDDNSLHISIKKSQKFKPYIQIASIWSDFKLSDNEAFENFKNVYNYICLQGVKFSTTLNNPLFPAFLLGIEDARLLNNDISRLFLLQKTGVKVLTLNWRGASCIGGGWDTNLPLTPFGKKVVRLCKDLKIIVDLSHSSSCVFWEVIKMSQQYNFTPIASHSNAFSIHNHKRNLSDEQFKALVDIDSLAGISLAPEHLGVFPDVDTILRHIEHYLSLNGENNIALGCDFDGVSSLPKGISSIKNLPLLFYSVEKSFGKQIAKKIFFHNAYNFFKAQNL